MTTLWPFPSSYPTALDVFTPVLFDNVDEVIANHPNSLASAIEALQAKLGLDNELVLGTGGLGFYAAGKAASPGRYTLWVNNNFAPQSHVFFTDEAGIDHDLSLGGGGGGIVWGDTLLIYIDSTNGSDAPGFGDGTPEKPYASLQWSTDPAVVPPPESFDDPADLPMFNSGVRYVLAPGEYAGADVLLPHRRFISFTGSQYVITCNVNWFYDYQYWFGENPNLAFQIVEFTTETPLMSWLNGNFTRMNGANNLVAGSNSSLILNGLQLGGDILNIDSGNDAGPVP